MDYKQYYQMTKGTVACLLILLVTSCVPPGKLQEAIEQNRVLEMRKDTVAKRLAAVETDLHSNIVRLNKNIDLLNDSIQQYRLEGLKPRPASQGDILLGRLVANSILNTSELNLLTANTPSIVWMDQLKNDIDTYMGKGIESKVSNGLVYVQIEDKLVFASGGNKVSSGSRAALKKLAILLKERPDVNLMIEGHTDNELFKKSAQSDNLSLSLQRAKTVADILTLKYKINPKRIIVSGRAAHSPIGDNHTGQGRASNRRVQFILIPSINQILQ